jgi:hypothetical protein
MNLFEIWKKQYRNNRYMENLSQDELKQRAKDVFLNNLILTGDCKIGLPPVNEEGQYWMCCWTHVLEEFFLRYGPAPAGYNGCFKEVKIPDPSSPLAKRASECVKKLNLQESGYIYKYGKSKYMRPAFEKGYFRISPASSYDDPSLNPAIRDKELEIEITINPNLIKINVIDGKTGEPKGSIEPIGNRLNYQSTTDYYVFCLASAFAPRLFLDFENDACLVIKDVDLFFKRMNVHLSNQLAGWLHTARPVNYIDPLNCNPNDIDIYITKHFRYYYQKEFRALWIPRKPENDLSPIDIEMGSLNDICEFIEI